MVVTDRVILTQIGPNGLKFRDGRDPTLKADARTHDVARMILSQPAPSTAMRPAQSMLMQASVDILPPWAKQLHGFPARPLASPLVRGERLHHCPHTALGLQQQLMLLPTRGKECYLWTPFLALSPLPCVMQGFRHEIWQLS